MYVSVIINVLYIELPSVKNLMINLDRIIFITCYKQLWNTTDFIEFYGTKYSIIKDPQNSAYN